MGEGEEQALPTQEGEERSRSTIRERRCDLNREKSPYYSPKGCYLGGCTLKEQGRWRY
nr:hypothetical protein ABT39_MTgene3387 [Picea glauca]